MDKVVPYPERFGVYDHLRAAAGQLAGRRRRRRCCGMVTGYSEFVNGGKKITPSLIDRIQDRNGKTIWRHDSRDCDGCNAADWHGQAGAAAGRHARADPRSAHRLSDRLDAAKASCSAAPAARCSPSASRWPARPAPRTIPRTSGSSASRPIWRAASMSASTIRARWASMEQGATVAAPIFRDFMKGALAGQPAAVPRRAGHRVRQCRLSLGRAVQRSGLHPRSVQAQHRAGRTGRTQCRHQRQCRCVLRTSRARVFGDACGTQQWRALLSLELYERPDAAYMSDRREHHAPRNRTQHRRDPAGHRPAEEASLTGTNPSAASTN